VRLLACAPFDARSVLRRWSGTRRLPRGRAPRLMVEDRSLDLTAPVHEKSPLAAGDGRRFTILSVNLKDF